MSDPNPYASNHPLLSLNQGGHLANTATPLPQFLDDISHFTTQLQTFSSATQELGSLHNDALRSTESSTGYSNGASARLEAAVSGCSTQARHLKDMLKALEREVLLTEREESHGGVDRGSRTKRGQWEKAKRDLTAALQEFSHTERSYQTRYNELLARQYRIVNPGASEAEIESAVQQGDSQVFSQALLSSNRSASANSVATAVRERQADIQRIERTILELAELFEQMNEQVVLSEPVVEAIEDLTSKVDTDLEGANIQLKQAVKSGYSARRKKFWCLGIGIAILLIIVAIVVIVVFVNKGKITPAPAPVPRMIKA